MGCVRSLNINGSPVDLTVATAHFTNVSGTEIQAQSVPRLLASHGIQECSLSPCHSGPCRNGGQCVPNKQGEHSCVCARGFSGE